MPVSRKLVASFVTSVLMFVIGLVVAKFGLTIDTATAAEISGFVAMAAGAVAGWFAKEAPVFEQEVEGLFERNTTPAERSAAKQILALGLADAKQSPYVNAQVTKLKAEADKLTADAARCVSAGNTEKAAELVSYANVKLAAATALESVVSATP